MPEESTDQTFLPWEELVPIYFPQPQLPDDESTFDTSKPHYEANYCEMQGSGTPCETSSDLYYGTTEPLAPRLCPQHYRELRDQYQLVGRSEPERLSEFIPTQLP